MNIISYSNCIYYNLSRKYLDKHKALIMLIILDLL